MLDLAGKTAKHYRYDVAIVYITERHETTGPFEGGREVIDKPCVYRQIRAWC